MHQINSVRRLALKGGAAACSLFLPLPYARVWAQSEGTLRLLRVPKIALVLGNSKYQHVSPLRNPANDAKAIGEVLRATGFQVTVKLDSERAEMAAAVQAYVRAQAANKGVGLFYYAGHGLQLVWRNYMLPVDAEIDTVADIQKQGVEVNALLEGLTKAANPMNIIILDACRDNPFGHLKGLEQKGLSQMDAPPSTILAYATSPGNVASDGDGSNGLYTGNLLRELKVGAAKVEDVFKRVRLGVRRSSNGQQIPWESTSLEEDFYFIPPKELRKRSEDEVQKLYEAESAVWEKAKESNSPAALEEYLRRYPSGHFSELAQLQLDRVLTRQGEKKIRIQSNGANPFSKGTGVLDTEYKIGDTYAYRVIDVLTRIERSRGRDTVVKLSANEVTYNGGLVTDHLGNAVLLRNGTRRTSSQTFVQEYSVGKRWETRSENRLADGTNFLSELNCHIAAREPISVPAGNFDAFRVDVRGWNTYPRYRLQIETRIWVAPERLRRYVAVENMFRLGNRLVNTDRVELVSFKQS